MSPLTTASAADSNFETGELALVSASMCFANLGQLLKLCTRAMTNCASARAHFDFDNLARTNSAIWFGCCLNQSRRSGSGTSIRVASVSSQLLDHSSMASRSPVLQALTRSFASFLYCSRLGRGGSGVTYIRI